MLLSLDPSIRTADRDWGEYLVAGARDFVIWGMAPQWRRKMTEGVHSGKAIPPIVRTTAMGAQPTRDRVAACARRRLVALWRDLQRMEQ